MESLSLFVPLLPGAALSPNAGRGSSWHRNAAATTELRDAVTVLARSAWSGPPLEHAVVSVTARIASKRPKDGRYRPTDVTNMLASCKPAVDGLVVAGVLIDDDWQHMALGSCRIERVSTVGDEGLAITVSTH
jgi:hypothetical protein